MATQTVGPIEGGTLELIAEMGGGVTYRQLDYWCRKGWIALADTDVGYGRPRRVSPAEAEAIKELVEVYEQANTTLAEIRSGEMYATILACQEDAQ